MHNAYKYLLLVSSISATSSCAMPPVLTGDSANVSNIKADETVVFFRTAAWQDNNGDWQVPIHGWIYEPQDSTLRKQVFAKVLEEKYDLSIDKSNEKIFSERVNLIIADNERGKQIVIKIANKTIKLPESSPNGHFQKTISLPARTVASHASNNVLSFTAVTKKEEKRRFSGEVLLIPPKGLSIISDIDDTVKISQVTEHKKLMEHTFLKAFEPAPGMAQLYRQWQTHGAAFHFVSSSPWQLYPPLASFTDEHKFPKASFSLKNIRFRDSTFFNLFKKGTQTKPAQIEPILQRYPQRRFILVGDSGEQDPEVYAGILKKHSKQIHRIYIRNVNGAKYDNERFSKAFAGIDRKRWQLFRDTGEINEEQLAAVIQPHH